MELNQAFTAELEREAASTKRLLERVPFDKFDWQPHGKSMTLGRLAVHVAELPNWVVYAIGRDGLDFASFQNQPYQPTGTEDLVRRHEECVAKAVAALETVSYDTLMQTWILRRGDFIITEQPKAGIIRGMAFNHLYHHRGQLSVYLRLLDVPVPGLYGPSFDDREAMAAAAAAADAAVGAK